MQLILLRCDQLLFQVKSMHHTFYLSIRASVDYINENVVRIFMFIVPYNTRAVLLGRGRGRFKMLDWSLVSSRNDKEGRTKRQDARDVHTVKMEKLILAVQWGRFCS